MHSVSKHVRLSQPTTKIFMNIDPYYERRRCSPMTLVSGNMRFMRIFAGVPWRGDVKQQWGIRKRRFSGLSGSTSSLLQYYLVPCRLPTDPKYVTLNDLEILNGHFTSNFHYYEPRFQRLGYILTVQSVCTRDQRRCAEAQERDLQNIWNLWKNCSLRIFRRRYTSVLHRQP